MLQGKKINHHTLRKACWLNPMITKIKQKTKKQNKIQNKDPIHGNKLPMQKS